MKIEKLIRQTRGNHPLDRVFHEAIALQESGQLEQAASLYQKILKENPKHGDSLNLLGGILAKQGKAEEGIALINEAIENKPDFAGYYFNRSQIYQKLQELDKAIEDAEKALSLNPKLLNAQLHLADLLSEKKDSKRAIRLIKKAMQMEPKSEKPYNALGKTYLDLNQQKTALKYFKKALELSPNDAVILNNVGRTLVRLGEIKTGVEHLNRALKIKPDSCSIHTNLGVAYIALSDSARAEHSLKKAIELNPSSYRSYMNLGSYYQDQGKFEEAEVVLRKALSINPNHADSQFNLGLCLLVQGNFEAGWPLYEARFDAFKKIKTHFSQPRWQGESLENKTLFLYTEQGFGDSIQFSRYIPLIKKQNTKIILSCQPKLTSLFKKHFPIDQFIGPDDSPAEFHYHCPLMSLPFVFKTTLDTIPSSAGYLSGPLDSTTISLPTRSKNKKRIGIVWTGNKSHKRDHIRSIPLNMLSPLLKLKDCEFFSLQCEEEAKQIEEFKLSEYITDLSASIQSFEDSASILEQLDLLITVDTSWAHLAGSMGKKAWVLIAYSPDFRWLLNRDDSPWYDSIRLFRQTELNNWEPVIKRTQEALSALLKSNA